APVALFFAVVFFGLGTLGLVEAATDLDDVEPWLWSGALVVLGLAGLAASIGRTIRDRPVPAAGIDGPARDDRPHGVDTGPRVDGDEADGPVADHAASAPISTTGSDVER
ncbi:MAG TPA: hypothetical protein VK866_05065, partial [Acidimicrobiales bacterium]|nr:hypothetical protein [Acidimicrobiales bacterium]